MVFYSCKRCGYGTIKKGDFRKHVERLTECKDKLQSGITFNEIKYLFEQEDHNVPKQYPCSLCSNVFPSAKARWNHKARVHPSTDTLTQSEKKIVNAIVNKIQPMIMDNNKEKEKIKVLEETLIKVKDLLNDYSTSN